MLLAADGYVGDVEEAQSGVMQMRVLSAPKLARYMPAADEVLVTISTPGGHARADVAGWVDVLALVFDDTGSLASPRPGVRPMNIEDARRVVAFVWRHRERRRLVISCDAGVSRSRSIAAAVAQHLKLPYRWTVLNENVFTLVSAVGEGAQKSSSPTRRAGPCPTASGPP